MNHHENSQYSAGYRINKIEISEKWLKQYWDMGIVACTSIGSVGKPYFKYWSNRGDGTWEERPGDPKRQALVGNVSYEYAQLDRPDIARRMVERVVDGVTEKTIIDTPENAKIRRELADANFDRFVRDSGYQPGQVVVMRATNPQRGKDLSPAPLKIIDVDQDDVFTVDNDRAHTTWLDADHTADMILTRDPEKVLGVRPGDCPIVVFRGTDHDEREFIAIEHCGWQNLNAGQLEQGIVQMAQLAGGADKLKVYISAGAHKEGFHYNGNECPGAVNSRFNSPLVSHLVDDVRFDEQDQKWHWRVDVFGYVDKALRSAGVDYVVHDGSDTADPRSGYPSLTRSANKLAGPVDMRYAFITALRQD